VYKVHHHASRYASNTTWLSVTSPKVSVVSVGTTNTYGHPTSETLARLHAIGTKTYWTSIGNGVAPVPGLDTVAGNIVVEVAPAATTFTLRYGSKTDTYAMWGFAPPGVPFGYVDTPAAGAVVAGEVAFTGWAVDDSGTVGVDVYRSPVPGEPTRANGLVYVGTAVMVPGARPDVARAYPLYPNVSSAGWGFMILTNTLPNAGNGTFTFQAIGRSASGETQLLGSRTFVVANAGSTQPFGTIDTPGHGETVSGTVTNFGWALTPNPRFIPTDGSTIGVYIDGVFVGTPNYGHYRADIATIFPGYANSNGAVGFYQFDSTTLANGLHTIEWKVTDSGGITTGMGSRFFRVENPQ
jgi:hypothetical protein